MPSSAETRRSAVSLTVASPSEPAPVENPRLPYVPWLVAALAWAAAAAAVGWVAVGALTSIAWLTAVHIPAADVLATMGQGWLALHGVPVVLGGATVRLVPWGLTLLVAAACAFAAHHAAAQYELPDDAALAKQGLAWASVTGACVAAYLVTGGVLVAIVGSPLQFGQAIPGLVLVPLLGAGTGAFWALGVDPLADRPAWLRRLPRGAALGFGVLALGALAALVVALVAHRERVVALHESLAPDAAGAVILTLVQAAYLPNLLAWAGSFVLGAGVDLGGGSIVAPGVADAALLPAVPVFGAVPAVPGVADHAWLVVGVAAALASAWWVLRDAEPRWVDHAWQGAVAGLAPGVLWVLASWFTGGDLGVERLAGLGPRFPELLAWGTLPLALAGAAYGLGRAFLLAQPAAQEEPATG